MTAKTMTAPFLTLPAALSFSGQVVIASVLAFFAGEQVSNNITGGVIGAICGAAAYVIGHIIAGIITLRKGRVDQAVTLDRERGSLMLQQDALHQYEVDSIRRNAHEREQFLQMQLVYYQQLELAERKRLHEVRAEAQRCLTHIRLSELDASPDGGKFAEVNWRAIDERYPLPSPPFMIQTGPETTG